MLCLAAMMTNSDSDITQFKTRRVFVGAVTKEQLLFQLQEAHVQLNDAAMELFGSELFTTSSAGRCLTTVELAVTNLGFSDGATMPEIQRAAISQGLCLPPLELGPNLRLQYLDQPEGHLGHEITKHRAPFGSLTIASAPISDDHAFPKGFYLRRIEEKLCLRGYRSDLEHIYHPDDRLVFCTGQ